jgi:hypothetical protein
VRIRAFFVSCLTIAIVIFSRLASAAPILDSVLIDGREWAQPDLFLGADTFPGVSWNQINSECPAGVCGNTSELNGWHLSGWTWAGVDDVDGLFDHYAERFPEFYDPGLIPVWPDRLREDFRPTSVPGNPNFRFIISGLTRDESLTNPLWARTAGAFQGSGIGDGSSPVTRRRFGEAVKSLRYPQTGAWFFRETIDVPAPATLALLAIGLLSLRLRRNF